MLLLITQVCLDHFQAEVDDLGRMLVPSPSFFAAEAGAEDVAGGELVLERGRRVLLRTRPCGHGRTLPFGGCSEGNGCVASV